MAWCLTAPSHYLHQYWLPVSRVWRHSPEISITGNAHQINYWNAFENYAFENQTTSYRRHRVDLWWLFCIYNPIEYYLMEIPFKFSYIQLKVALEVAILDMGRDEWKVFVFPDFSQSFTSKQVHYFLTCHSSFCIHHVGKFDDSYCSLYGDMDSDVRPRRKAIKLTHSLAHSLYGASYLWVTPHDFKFIPQINFLFDRCSIMPLEYWYLVLREFGKVAQFYMFILYVSDIDDVEKHMPGFLAVSFTHLFNEMFWNLLISPCALLLVIINKLHKINNNVIHESFISWLFE